MNTQSSYQVVDEHIAGSTGAIVFWRLTSHGTDHQELCNAWVAAGLPESMLPDTPTPRVACARAVKAQQNANCFARRAGAAHVLVDEASDGEGGLKHAQTCRVELNDVFQLDIQPEDHPIREALEAAYQKALDHVTETDVSGWLTGTVVPHLDAVRLRDTGGIYFIPQTRIDEWHKVRDIFRAHTKHIMFELPAMTTDETVEAVLSAIVREAEDVVETIESEMTDRQLQGRALTSRQRRCDAILQKVGRYETLLGRNLEVIREQITGLDAVIVASALALEEEDD